MLAQVLAQGLRERATALIAQRMQALVTQHHQGAKGRAVFLHHPQAGFGDPRVGHQRLFEHGQ